MSAGEPAPLTDAQDEWAAPAQENLLAALIDQMQQNWDLGNDAANDVLVVQIREHIRRQRVRAEPGCAEPAPPRRRHPIGRDGDVAGGRWMPEDTQAVADDVDYWSEHGVQVVSIRPRVDGSGAVIGVRRLTNHITIAMQQRYTFPVYCWDVPPLR